MPPNSGSVDRGPSISGRTIKKLQTHARFNRKAFRGSNFGWIGKSAIFTEGKESTSSTDKVKSDNKLVF
jgi:hypothetical protein